MIYPSLTSPSLKFQVKFANVPWLGLLNLNPKYLFCTYNMLFYLEVPLYAGILDNTHITAIGRWVTF